MAEPDLIAFAKASGSAGDDLFSLLSIDATASEQDIRRAFRKKALTAHPDKAGDNYDPALYEKLEKARDVLTNKEAREVYESGMKAILQKRKEREMMSEKRRRLVEDLEQREREAENSKKMKMTGGSGVDLEEERMRREMEERGKRKLEERRKLKEEAERREKEREEREYDEKIKELERKIEEKRAMKKAAKKKAAKKEGDKEALPPPSPPPAAGKDGEKAAAAPSPPPTVSDEPAPTAPPQPQPALGATSKPSDRFASTMARLRAAQAKKDEERRKREAEVKGEAVA
ncbi:hypothetical protein QBC44DRAFT_334965 [Cladorrhinum sp. PSN332]|nr:hypothetical protein QBC44DRAFT_334965 [Cladorrhinum sp. PSN332]